MPENIKNFVLGLNAKLYYCATLLSEANTPDDLTWIELNIVKDVSLNLSKDTADITVRANNGWKSTVGTLKDGSINFQTLWQPGNTIFQTLLDSFLNNTELAFLVLDGDLEEAGNQGLACNGTVNDFTANQALTEAVTADTVIGPTSYQQWHTVAT